MGVNLFRVQDRPGGFSISSIKSSLIGFQILHSNQPFRNHHLLSFGVVIFFFSVCVV